MSAELLLKDAEHEALERDREAWIVRPPDPADISEMSGAELNDGGYACSEFYRPGPPAELVAAAAPCLTCGGMRWVVEPVEELGHGYRRLCPDCRITLLGECPRLDRNHPVQHLGYEGHCGNVSGWGSCDSCTDGRAVLGYAYAASEVLPILGESDWFGTTLPPTPHLLVLNGVVFLVESHHVDTWDDTPVMTDALAHYGHPASLVGQYALKLVLA